ncbi:MAG: type VI secretion system tube protein Hcp [Acidobacteriota bacterium]|nr:type VI secretion system tube protein Hcp [Acidobacteriota bacterium]
MKTILRRAAIALIGLLVVSPASAVESCVRFASGVQPSPQLPDYCKDGSFLALDVHHLLRRTGSGGQGRILEDIVLRKRLDASSPGLWSLLDNQSSQEVTISFYQTNGAATEFRARLILSGARVVAIEPATPRESEFIKDLERIRLQYDVVTLEYKDGSSSAISR